MSDDHEDLTPLRVVMFTANEPFDLDVVDDFFPMTIVVGSKIPVYEIETQDCENGCCTRALLHDTANDRHYMIGQTTGPSGPAPPPLLVQIALRNLQGVLN
jgi:hypothetical protein